jgi:glycosidase
VATLVKRALTITLVTTLISSLLFLAPSSTAMNLPAFKPIARGALAQDSVYFVMTDRFDNGNPQNDDAFVPGGPLVNGLDKTDIGFWHGGDFVGLTEKLPYIKKMGFTSIWITPPVVQNWVQQGSAAYHGYWGTDFTTVDPHLGTEEEFRYLIARAHALGMKVIVDIVVNHTADIIFNSYGMYNYATLDMVPYKDSRGKEFNLLQFVGKKNFPTLDVKKSFPRPPVVGKSNAKIKKPTFLNNLTNYHNRGDSTFSGESSTYGDFFGLDDLFTEKPEVIEGMIKLWSSWIAKFDIDGYRIDTAKHVNPEFWNSFLPKIMAAAKIAGKPDFAVFGEVYDANPYFLSTFVHDQSFPSVLDFGFQRHALGFAKTDGQVPRLIDLFNQDDLYTTATQSAYGIPTFMGNHDMGRVGYFIESATYGDEELTFRRSKLANEVLFFSRGAPVLYYGDEKGMVGSGGDKSARQDMFPTQVIEWQNEYRIGSSPVGTQSSFDITNPLEQQITSIGQLIKANPALRSGTQQLRSTSRNAIAMSRYLNDQEYIVVFNSGESEETIKVPVSTDSTWEVIYGAALAIDVAGKSISLTVPAISTVVLKAGKKFTATNKLMVNLAKVDYDFATPNWLSLRASVPGDDFTQVNFQIRKQGSTQWINVGTSDRRTFETSEVPGGLYRVFTQPRKFKSGTTIEVVAIAKSAAGEIAYSKVRTFKITY